MEKPYKTCGSESIPVDCHINISNFLAKFNM